MTAFEGIIDRADPALQADDFAKHLETLRAHMLDAPPGMSVITVLQYQGGLPGTLIGSAHTAEGTLLAAQMLLDYTAILVDSVETVSLARFTGLAIKRILGEAA